MQHLAAFEISKQSFIHSSYSVVKHLNTVAEVSRNLFMDFKF